MRNIIERAVIRPRGSTLEFDILVAPAPSGSRLAKPREVKKPENKFLGESKIRQLESENLVAVLQRTGWKIKGPDGAAELLGGQTHHLALPHQKKMKLERSRLESV